MILRWVGAALVEHSRGFRRLRGHAGMRALVAALRALDGAEGVAQHGKAALEFSFNQLNRKAK